MVADSLASAHEILKPHTVNLLCWYSSDEDTSHKYVLESKRVGDSKYVNDTAKGPTDPREGQPN